MNPDRRSDALENWAISVFVVLAILGWVMFFGRP
jgi:hypothetical protein